MMASIFSARTYVKFCQETTLHGLKHTVSEQFHWVERLLWFILTCAAFLGAVYCALRQLSRYNSEPVVVSLRRDYRSWWTVFPAVTACFLDRVQRAKAQDTIEMLWNVTKESNPGRYQYYLGFIELVSDVSFRTNLQNFWKYQTDETVKGVDLLQLALDVHPTFPLKVMVSKQDKEVQWVPVMTEMGMCMTFNSEYAVYQFLLPNVDWSVDQLLKCHYLSGQCFVRVDSMNNAIKYFVHSPFDIPNALSNPTREVMPGEELVMDFKAVEIQAAPGVKNLRPEQRRCRYPDEWISDSIRMAKSVTRTAWRASDAMLRSSSICRRTWLNAPAYLNVPSSTTILIQKRSLFVLPFGLDVGLLGVATYYSTRLKRPDPVNVMSIFGPEVGSKEAEANPDQVVQCIAHRGAGLDAPENTLEAFKYCVERECNFVELDVRTLKDGQLVLLHDQGLQRLSESSITDVTGLTWEDIKDIDIGVTHPNRQRYKEVKICLLDAALDYLLEKQVRCIIDVKGDNKEVINGILNTFEARPALYKSAAVTCFNPATLYQIRKRDPKIVGAISYRPYSFSAQDFDAEHGPTNPRFGDNLPVHVLLRLMDLLHSVLWRWTARWCGVSAVLLHKDTVSLCEVRYWRTLGVRLAGWSVNRPVEKLYWRCVLRAPYLANTLAGEKEREREPQVSSERLRSPSNRELLTKLHQNQ
ncbi:uncharacterized protein LOC125240005 [Leguminivora glycinivorella]|uniref:uncharacterized protein LOC125240005 n=1 Tax=Leguminivora glycinivorella TaxID=1035111 RepID=UPI00200C7834|nr:uncharacterized protein LOC125240005 [Leguminivora glycinivorella]